VFPVTDVVPATIRTGQSRALKLRAHRVVPVAGSPSVIIDGALWTA
jgi:hypothetical protein